jgi:hypothetical protein
MIHDESCNFDTTPSKLKTQTLSYPGENALNTMCK